MAVVALAVDSGSASSFGGKITWSVVVTCIVAALCGLMTGYDIGISGGVTTMVPFLREFFPSVLRKAAEAKSDLFCVYDSAVLTSFTSSLCLASLVTALMASRLSAAIGRRNLILLGGCTFLAGGAINGGAVNVAMLILGRLLLGFGLGFTGQAAPLYLSETAPSKWRGAFNTGFQFFLGVGVVVSNCINFGTAKLTWGWRLSLGLAIAPGAMITLGALIITDTPSSLVERGKLSQARKALLKVRGANTDVEPELAQLIRNSKLAKAINEEPFIMIFKRHYRPHLVMGIMMPCFQMMTGINIVAFYAPVLFQAVGFGNDSALVAAIILGVVNLGSILVSTFLVDRYGRRPLFIVGGVLMFICQIIVALLLAFTAGVSGTGHISRENAILILAFMCIYVAGYGWSWGPLTLLIPSEIYPIEIRATGQSITISVGSAIQFVLAQTFLTMLCHFKFGTFLFFAAWIAIMTLYVVFLLPETKGIHLDSMYTVWEEHWYWSRFVKE